MKLRKGFGQQASVDLFSRLEAMEKSRKWHIA